MIWIFTAKHPVPPGYVNRIVVNHPSNDTKTVWAFIAQHCKENQLLTKGAKYALFGPVNQTDQNAIVLAVQCHLGNLSGEAVGAALSSPHGQPGQNRPDAPLDSMGFQALGDMALPIRGDDAMFGEADDGTVSDIYQNGGGLVEQARPRFGADLNGPARGG
jgi:hypothetical protein